MGHKIPTIVLENNCLYRIRKILNRFLQNFVGFGGGWTRSELLIGETTCKDYRNWYKARLIEAISLSFSRAYTNGVEVV